MRRRLRILLPSILKNRSVRALWTTELGDAVDRAIRSVAVPWLVLELTGNTLSLGLAFALYSAPDVLLAPAIGHAIDVLPPRRTLAIGELLQGLLVIGLGALAITGSLDVLHVYVILVGLSIVVGLTHNARRTLLPDVADEAALNDANAALDGIRSLLGLIALASGGWIVANLGTGRALIVSGLAPIVSTAALLGVSVPSHDRDAENDDGGIGGLIGGIRETAHVGYKTIRDNRVIRNLLAFGIAINLLVVPLSSVLIPTVGRRVFRGAIALTILLGAFRAGSLVGTMIVPRLQRPNKTLIVLGSMTVGVATLTTGLVAGIGQGSSLVLSGTTGALFVVGGGMPLFNVPTSSVLQAAAPEERRGTVVTGVNATLQSVFPIPLLLAGWLLVTVPATSLFVGIGLGTIGVAVWTATSLEFERPVTVKSDPPDVR